MNKTAAFILLIACACIIYFERSIPWLAFGKKEMPSLLKKLADLLPPALMAILVVYGLKSITTANTHTILSMIVASLFTIVIHVWKKNQILSVFLGTAVYMLLLNL